VNRGRPGGGLLRRGVGLEVAVDQRQALAGGVDLEQLEDLNEW